MTALHGQITLCGEPPLSGDWLACGRPAVGPHPDDGYPRPLCSEHMRRAVGDDPTYREWRV